VSTMWNEDLDTDAEYDDAFDEDWEGEDTDDLDGEDESYLDGEDAESRASRRRRARARRMALARRRQALARSRAQIRARTQPGAVSRPRPTPAPVRQPAPSAAAAIRSVDLEAKVADDSLRREIAAQRKRMNRSDYAAVAGLAVNQFMDSFGEPENAYLRAALRTAPLMLLDPQRRGEGVGAFVTDPRVIGGVAALGIAFLGEQQNKARIEVAAPYDVALNGQAQVVGQVLSTRGTELAGRQIQWRSSNPAIAEVDADGLVRAKGQAGAVFIIARVEGLPDKRVPIVVK
jgi:hypothetical protein